MRIGKVILWLIVVIAAMLALGGCQPVSTEPTATVEDAPSPTSTPRPTADPTATRTPKPPPSINLPTPYTGPLPDGVVQQIGLGALTEVSVSPRGTYVALGATSTVTIFDATTYEQVWSVISDNVNSLAWAADESRLAAGSFYGITVWEASTGRQLFKTAQERQAAIDLAFTPDGLRLIGAKYDGTLKVLDGTTGELIRSLEYHETPPDPDYPDAELAEFSLSPDGRMAALSFTYGQGGAATPPSYGTSRRAPAC